MLRQQPLQSGQNWHYVVRMTSTSAVFVWTGVYLCSYHPGIPTLLEKWNESVGEDVHRYRDGVTGLKLSSVSHCLNLRMRPHP